MDDRQAYAVSTTPDEVAERLAAIESTFSRSTQAGICVTDGFGVTVTVNRGALVIQDGVAQQRRIRRFDRATHQISRLVVRNVTGMVSFDALRWCEALGIGVVLLGPDDRPLMTSAPQRTDDARLRRIQARAGDLYVGLDIARTLIANKVLGEARVLTTRLAADEAASMLLNLVPSVESASSLEEVRGLEATAAACYWQSWVGRAECAPHFSSRDLQRVPGHWRSYDGRRSVLASANSNRSAERPVNALLNYLFALLESETVMACYAVGLDPGMGVMHRDAKNRHSMADDLMEPVRPEVESYVLDLLRDRTFKKADFIERSDGSLRLMAPLTHELAETIPHWQSLVAPVVERVAHALGQEMEGKYVSHTPLTKRRHRDAQAVVKARRAATGGVAANRSLRQQPATNGSLPYWACPDCGGVVTDRHRVRCDACIARDPSQAPAVRAKRGQAISSRKRALREQKDLGLPEHWDAVWFRREVLPRLAEYKLAIIMERAGCSKGFASDIRRGRYLPNVSTWRALADLVGIDLP
jgi:CRISPR-associated endonuclease Cas1